MIIHEINMDLQFRGVAPVIDAVQGDSLSRSIKINLFSAGQPWEMPDGASAALRYRKTDGKGGIYSNLPDGTEAWEVDGNSVTILLINQVLNVPGAVVADMIIIQADSVLATFPLAIRVSPAPSADVVESDNYFGIPLDDTLTVSGAAADAAAVGVRLKLAERNIEGLLQDIPNLMETTVPKSGGAMTGDLDMGGNTVTGLGDPADDTDAVPKGYLERRLEDFGGTGGGEAGGYYTPAVSQPEAGSMEIRFDASSGEMPEVAPVLVALPQGEKGDTGPQGEKGDTGPQGEKGDTGADGYTPVKGVDYFTADDKNELVQAVLAALPAAEEGSF